MSKSKEKNDRSTHSQFIKANENVGRIKQKVIEEYLDLEKGVIVKVLQGIEDIPYRTIPTGWSD